MLKRNIAINGAISFVTVVLWTVAVGCMSGAEAHSGIIIDPAAIMVGVLLFITWSLSDAVVWLKEKR